MTDASNLNLLNSDLFVDDLFDHGLYYEEGDDLRTFFQEKDIKKFLKDKIKLTSAQESSV
jgi:hypothetical protein